MASLLLLASFLKTSLVLLSNSLSETSLHLQSALYFGFSTFLMIFCSSFLNICIECSITAGVELFVMRLLGAVINIFKVIVRVF